MKLPSAATTELRAPCWLDSMNLATGTLLGYLAQRGKPEVETVRMGDVTRRHAVLAEQLAGWSEKYPDRPQSTIDRCCLRSSGSRHCVRYAQTPTLGGIDPRLSRRSATVAKSAADLPACVGRIPTSQRLRCHLRPLCHR